MTLVGLETETRIQAFVGVPGHPSRGFLMDNRDAFLPRWSDSRSHARHNLVGEAPSTCQRPGSSPARQRPALCLLYHDCDDRGGADDKHSWSLVTQFHGTWSNSLTKPLSFMPGAAGDSPGADAWPHLTFPLLSRAAPA